MAPQDSAAKRPLRELCEREALVPGPPPVRERSGGTFDLPEGTIYPALHRLERAGLLASDWAEANGRRRRVYALTGKGAAALAAGLTETEAAEAAISSFGSVRAVVRAHQTRRSRAVAALSGLAMTTWLLAGTVLLPVFALGLVALVVMLAARRTPQARTPTPSRGSLLTSLWPAERPAQPCW